MARQLLMIISIEMRHILINIHDYILRCYVLKNFSQDDLLLQPCTLHFKTIHESMRYSLFLSDRHVPLKKLRQLEIYFASVGRSVEKLHFLGVTYNFTSKN